MKRTHAVRGAALPETALVLTATLGMVFAIIQIGVIGFLQIMTDGAAFIAAHEYALGNTTTYLTIAQRPFPLLAPPIVIDTNQPDPTTVAVNYNTSSTTTRHGGVSLIRGSHLMATVTNKAPTGLLGVGVAGLSGVSVHGSAIEPENLMSNFDYDVNGDGYSATSSPAQNDYWASRQNAPLNYINMEEMAYCSSATFDTVCSASAVAVRALGTAEFLDQDNWNRTNLGVGTYTGGFTFGEMLCHQQYYAAAAQTVFKGAMPSASLVSLSNTNSIIGKIYSWDFLSSLGGGYTHIDTSFGLYPLTPGNYCP